MKQASLYIIGILISFVIFSCNQSKENSFIIPPNKVDLCTDRNECVYYRVPYKLYALKQPTKNSCWATVLAMLISWREQKKFTIENVLKRYDKRYTNLFLRSESIGISITDEIELYKQVGLVTENQLNPTIKGWEDYLKEYGPLSVTIDANPPFGGTVHSILVTGIYGKTDAQNTFISFIDPIEGKEKLLSFMTFIKMYEGKYSVDWQIQIIHFN